MFNDDDELEDQASEELAFVDWIEPPLHLCNTSRLLQPYMLDRLYDSFHLFQTDPSVQVNLCFYRCPVFMIQG